MSNKIPRITRQKSLVGFRTAPRPALPKRLFWEFRYEKIDWVGDYGTVIERVDFTISKVCEYFKLKQEELRCYTRKQLRKGHWI